MQPLNFLTGAELGAAELDALLDRAIELKAAPLGSRALAGRGVALIFEKPSTRTRVSFEMGVHELGGHAVVLRSGEMQLSRGESPRDTALVLSRQVAAIAVRTGPDSLLEELARYASVPVINMLTALHHPCQALADLMTMRESFGSLTGLRIAYVGDGTNVARSLAVLGTIAGMDVAIASPAGYALEEDLSLPAGAEGSLTLYPGPVRGGAWRARVVHRRVGEYGRRGHRRAASGCIGAVPDRRRAAGRGGPGCDRPALPACAPGRGDHRRCALRSAPANLGSGRESSSRAEGPARAFDRFAAAMSASVARERQA